MQFRNDGPENDAANPLKAMTAEQFAALGGSAVAYVRQMKAPDIAEFLNEEALLSETDEDFHLVMSADGTPLLVTDTEDAVREWLTARNVGLVTLH